MRCLYIDNESENLLKKTQNIRIRNWFVLQLKHWNNTDNIRKIANLEQHDNDIDEWKIFLPAAVTATAGGPVSFHEGTFFIASMRR